MSVVIAEFKQESNTRARPTTVQHFEEFHLLRGAAMLEELGTANAEVGGYAEVLAASGIECVPTMAGFAVSGGPLTADAFSRLQGELLDRISDVGNVDGILLALHGAMVAEGEPDADGATIAAVREIVGDRVPIAVSMDLHANLTQRGCEAADIVVGFRTCPHIDQRETGSRAARLLVATLEGRVAPTMAWRKIPMVVPASTHLDFAPGPFRRVIARTVALEERGAIDSTLFAVQPWMDVPELGFAAVVITDGDQPLAEELVCEVATTTWGERHAFLDVELVPPDEAIRRALAHERGPVVLTDLADGTGAGSPGDSPTVVGALLRAAPDRVAYASVCDPEVVATAERAGLGAGIDVLLGGKRDDVYNSPLPFRGDVVHLGAASFTFTGVGYHGMRMDMGKCAVLRHGKIFVLVTSLPAFTVDPAFYEAVGLDPVQAHIVVVKSHAQFQDRYSTLAQAIIHLDTPGVSPDTIASLDFPRIPRPTFPWDPDTEYVCSPDSG